MSLARILTSPVFEHIIKTERLLYGITIVTREKSDCKDKKRPNRQSAGLLERAKEIGKEPCKKESKCKMDKAPPAKTAECKKAPEPPCKKEPEPTCKKAPEPPCKKAPEPPCKKAESLCAKAPESPCKKAPEPTCKKAAATTCKKAAAPTCKKEAAPCKKEAAPCKKEAAPCKKEAAPCKKPPEPCKKPPEPCKPKQLMNPRCKIAIVTGGTVGIGLAAVCYLLKAGLKHIVFDGRRKELGETAAHRLNEEYGEDSVTYMQGCVNDEAHFRAMFECCKERFGGTDILFNNAGMLNDKEWDKSVDTNVKGVIRGTLLGFEYMGKNTCGKGGLIINNASIVGLQALPGSPIYSTTKFGVIGTVLNFGAEFHYKCTGIRVIAVCPGVTDTDLISQAEGKQYNAEWGKESVRELKALPAQQADALGKGIVYMVNYAPTATVWVVEGNELLLAKIPDRHCYSELVKKLC